MTTALLRWAGSKKQLLPLLNEYWDKKYNRYIEPFFGSGQLFFKLKPEKAIINDINNNLINMYKAVRKSPRIVNEELLKYRISKEQYIKLRKNNVSELDIYKQAARFLYLNRFCFNGLYRTNLKGEFNVPFSDYKVGKLPDLTKLQEAALILRGKLLLSQDFETVISKHIKEDDFVYMDPPYAVNNARIFTQYDRASFGVNDIKRLKETINIIHERRAYFVLSYAYCPEFSDLFSNYKQKIVYTKRSISGFSSNCKRAPELLVTNVG